MNGYEWHVHRREHNYRSISGNFVKFSSSVKRLSEKIYSQQAVYTPYTPMELGDRCQQIETAVSAGKFEEIEDLIALFDQAIAEVDKYLQSNRK